MKGTVLYGPRDVRFEERPEPRIEKPNSDASMIVKTRTVWPGSLGSSLPLVVSAAS
jgi:hypothetical protein